MEQILVSIQTLYCCSISAIKLSVLLFYHRIFGNVQPMFSRALLIVGGFVIAYGLTAILATVFQCVPLSALWKPPSSNPPVCIHFGLLVVAVGVVNIGTDIAILSLPIPIVWTLRMPKSRRWQVILVFSLGGL